MYARSVSLRLKSGRATEFTQKLENDVIPVLRKQKGFCDELTFVAPDGSNAIGISLWDVKDNADVYARVTYPGVAKTMEPLVEGTPQVNNYEVSNSTFHKIAAHMTTV